MTMIIIITVNMMVLIMMVMTTKTKIIMSKYSEMIPMSIEMIDIIIMIKMLNVKC